jgi:hypothetical protein
MRRIGWVVLLALAGGFAVAGCAGDAGKALMKDAEKMSRVMDMIAADPATAGGMTDRLLGMDGTRTMVLQKLVSSAGGAQQVMETVARDQTLMDGALTQAMKDPVMRAHVITLFKGMQMAGAK